MIFGNSDYWKAWREANMPKEEVEEAPKGVEIDSVTGWRYTFLLGLGFEPLDCLEMAVNRNVDIHRASDLLGQGCPVDTAVRILL